MDDRPNDDLTCCGDVLVVGGDPGASFDPVIYGLGHPGPNGLVTITPCEPDWRTQDFLRWLGGIEGRRLRGK